MKTRILKQIGSSALIVIGLTLAFSSVSARGPARTVEGAWRNMVTPVNCQTGVPLAPPFRSLLTFNEGGTMSEYGITPGLTPALRSPGHGVWQRGQGWADYSFAFTFYRYDASGLFIGSTAAMTLVHEPAVVRRVAWRAYMPQAGIALALAATIASDFPEGGEQLSTIIIAVVVLNEASGPFFLRSALRATGEAPIGQKELLD